MTANLGLSLADNSTHVLLGATELVWVLLLAVLINKVPAAVCEQSMTKDTVLPPRVQMHKNAAAVVCTNCLFYCKLFCDRFLFPVSSLCPFGGYSLGWRARNDQEFLEVLACIVSLVGNVIVAILCCTCRIEFGLWGSYHYKLPCCSFQF